MPKSIFFLKEVLTQAESKCSDFFYRKIKKILLVSVFAVFGVSIAGTSSVYAFTTVYKPSNGFLFTDCATSNLNPVPLGISSTYFSTGVDSSGTMYQTFPCTTTHTTSGLTANFPLNTDTVPLTDSGATYLWIIMEGRASGSDGYAVGGTDYLSQRFDVSARLTDVHYFLIDGYRIEAMRISLPSECVSFLCDTFSGDSVYSLYPNRTYDINDRYRFYGMIVTDDAGLSITDEASMISALGVDPVPPVVATSSVTSFVGASLYSASDVIVSPTSSTTYTFTSPLTDISQKQGAVVQISHASSVTPSVSWGGVSMYRYISSPSASSGYVSSLYYLASATSSAPIVISSIASGTLAFISATVWNNGNSVASVDAKAVIPGSTAIVDIASLTVSPITIVGSMATAFRSSLERQSSTALMMSATSSLVAPVFTFDVLRRSCNGVAGLTDCPLGYDPIAYAFPFGNLVAIGLYSSSTEIVTPPLGSTPVVYAICDTFDIGCYISNSGRFLFIPSSDSISQFSSLTLASSAPFSYVYDMGNLFDELFNTSTTTTLNFTIPFSFVGHASSSITLISHDMLTNTTQYPYSAPVAIFIRYLITVLLWFGFAQFAWRQIMQVHNKEHTA